ncbi:MAG: hypothetical protein NTX64_16025 [Elusimicrobia bacterium]|nr:hypothetical protein [Elusimicrobiota bacterium]
MRGAFLVRLSHWARLARWRDRSPAIYAAVFIASAVAVSAAWPIMRTDTDLWYHLAGGRFLAETGHIPTNSYFPFLQPPRPYVDYYWLFQALVYRVFRWGGWGGLVALRTVLFAALAALLGVYAFSGRVRRPAWSAFLTVLLLIALFPRCLVLRPHLCEYLLIAAFLFILEERPRWAWLLPPLGVLWGNLHGVSYPVLLWLCGSYVGERLLARLPWSPDRERRALDDTTFACAALAMAAVFVTPFGHHLIDVPFIPLDRVRYQVGELHPVRWGDLVNWALVEGGPSGQTAFNIFLVLGGLAWIEAARRGRARAAHLLLLLGGMLLLTRCRRFFYEMALFSLPLLRDHPPFKGPRPRGVIAASLVAAALVASSFAPLVKQLRDRPAYPYSVESLPQGVTAFLNKEGGGGKVLQHPDLGGYYEWEVVPRYRIGMDMELPFMFSQEDFFLAHQAFASRTALKYFVETYHPEFIAAPRARPGFMEVIKGFPEYRPVFTDEDAALYASRKLRPALVRRWELPVNPMMLPEVDSTTLKATGPFEGCVPGFIARMIAVAPDNPVPRAVAARSCTERGDTAKAEAHARVMIRMLPEMAVGWRLLAEAYEKGGRDADAAAAYEQVLRRAQRTSEFSTTHQRLANLYRRLGDVKRAARHDYLVDPALPPMEGSNNNAGAGARTGGKELSRP